MEQCPKCNGPLKEVTYQSNSMLNRDQFDAVRAGDFYCTSCKGSESSSGYKYFWLRELLQLPAREPEPITEIIDCAEYKRLKADSAELATLKAEQAADTELFSDLLSKARQAADCDVSRLCESNKHKPLRSLFCGECQLAGRLEELQAAVDAIDAARKEEK